MAKESLSAGLNRSADKRGLSGAARTRYIAGGAINAEKRHEARLRRGHYIKKPTSGSKRGKAGKAPAPRVKLELVVRKNASASKDRSYDVYSLYEGKSAKRPYTSATYRTRGAAQQAAKVAMESHNHPKGVHSQKGFY